MPLRKMLQVSLEPAQICKICPKPKISWRRARPFTRLIILWFLSFLHMPFKDFHTKYQICQNAFVSVNVITISYSIAWTVWGCLVSIFVVPEDKIANRKQSRNNWGKPRNQSIRWLHHWRKLQTYFRQLHAIITFLKQTTPNCRQVDKCWII